MTVTIDVELVLASLSAAVLVVSLLWNHFFYRDLQKKKAEATTWKASCGELDSQVIGLMEVIKKLQEGDEEDIQDDWDDDDI